MHILGESFRQKFSPYVKYGSNFVLNFHPRLYNYIKSLSLTEEHRKMHILSENFVQRISAYYEYAPFVVLIFISNCTIVKNPFDGGDYE